MPQVFIVWDAITMVPLKNRQMAGCGREPVDPLDVMGRRLPAHRTMRILPGSISRSTIAINRNLQDILT
jgi:hypothetical protein